jgi:putative MFS transporter
MLSLGFFFTFFDITVLSPVLPRVGAEFHVGLAALGHAGSLLLAGYIPGAILVSLIGDVRGRKIACLAAFTTFGVASLGRGFSTNMGMFDAFTFVAGLGAGGGIDAVATFAAELAPSRLRGRFSALSVTGAYVGSGAATAIALGLVDHVSWGWRLFLAIPVLGVISLAFLWSGTPESPRWLVAHGQEDLAGLIVSEAERRSAARLKIEVSQLPQPELLASQGRTEGLPFLRALVTLFRPPQLWYLLLWFFIWGFTYFPTYGFATVGIPLLVQSGYTLEISTAIGFCGVGGGILATLIASQLSDRASRKGLAAGSSFLLAASAFAVGFHTVTWLIIVTIILLSFQAAMFSALLYVSTAEHFPTAVRNTGLALADGGGHLGGVIGPTVATSVFAAYGFGAVWVMFGASFAMAGALIFFTKNRAGKRLETLGATGPAGTMEQVVIPNRAEG